MLEKLKLVSDQVYNIQGVNAWQIDSSQLILELQCPSTSHLKVSISPELQCRRILYQLMYSAVAKLGIDPHYQKVSIKFHQLMLFDTFDSKEAYTLNFENHDKGNYS